MRKIFVTTEKCLKRAKKLFRSGKEINLIYAALELRLGIECRLKEYIEAHEQIPKKLKKVYKLNELNKTILKYLKLNDKVAKIEMIHPKMRRRVILYYTPVRKQLIEIGQKLGNFLHYPVKNMIELKNIIEAGIKELTFSNKGDLMGPPLGNFGNKKTYFISVAKNRKKQRQLKQFMKNGLRITMKVEYLDDFPK